jgi:hypothetical protein
VCAPLADAVPDLVSPPLPDALSVAVPVSRPLAQCAGPPEMKSLRSADLTSM